MDEPTLSGSTGEQVPDFDSAAVGRMAGVVQLESIELVELQFTDAGAGQPIIDETVDRGEAEWGLSVEWALNEKIRRFSCIVRTSMFLTPSDMEPKKIEVDEAQNAQDSVFLGAAYRLSYTLNPGAAVTHHECDQFAHWNVPFNSWPFWREVAANTLQRSRHTPFLVPLFRMPR